MYTGINVNMYRLGIMSMNNAYLDKDFKRAFIAEHATNTEVAQGSHRWQRCVRSPNQ